MLAGTVDSRFSWGFDERINPVLYSSVQLKPQQFLLDGGLVLRELPCHEGVPGPSLGRCGLQLPLSLGAQILRCWRTGLGSRLTHWGVSFQEVHHPTQRRAWRTSPVFLHQLKIVHYSTKGAIYQSCTSCTHFSMPRSSTVRFVTSSTGVPRVPKPLPSLAYRDSANLALPFSPMIWNLMPSRCSPPR